MVQENLANSRGESPSGLGRTVGIEAIGISPAVFEDRSAFVAAARQGLPGLVVKQAVNELGHRDLFVRLLGTTGGNLNRLYRRKALGPLLEVPSAAVPGGIERIVLASPVRMEAVSIRLVDVKADIYNPRAFGR
ncbi:MAG: hypothetical protein OXQ29_14545 [Rhodospirillaceae bacterium]|nr:hypothetical protein [Rhodospirillaceae bacterium]